jgi:phage shock protein A
MSADLASMKQSLARLRQERADLETIRKEAFMAAPPMPGGGMPPGMDPSMMQGGMPPQGMPVDPNTGMPMDPSMMQGGMPPQQQPPPASPITPEMLEEIIGVIEQLAAGSEQHEKEMQGMKQQLEDVMANFDELEQRLAQMFSGPQQGM